MIYLYSGTPGSGKSLHMANDIYLGGKMGRKQYIVNFPIATEKLKHPENIKIVDNDWLTVDNLMKYAMDYWKDKPVKEGYIKLYIDEAQVLFNSRDYQKNYKEGWVKFFSNHRHLGYDIIMVSQFDRMLDRQIRSLIEHECKHRKAKEMGIGGQIYNIVALGGLFVYVDFYYPLKMKTGMGFFKFNKKVASLYDTHALFALGAFDGVTGSPSTGPQ